MSDSSSSDDETSRFREVCDPTLWRAVTQEVSKDEMCRVEASDSQHHHHSQADLRQSFILLEKVRTSLANGQGKTACGWLRQKACHSTQGKQVGRAEAGTVREAVSAPSTLSPFLAKQLTSRLDGSVEYQTGQEDKLTMDGGGRDGQHSQHLQHPLYLLNNLPLTALASITPTPPLAMKDRAARVPKRLTYFDGCNGKLKTQCQSVAMSPQCILSGEAAYPWPHPKNVRYLEEYKLMERRADGSIIATPCSLPGDVITATTTTARKKKKKKGVEHVSQTGKEDSSMLQQEEALTGFQNGGFREGISTKRKKNVPCTSQTGKDGSAKITHEATPTSLQNGGGGSNSSMRKERKQTRKRGKKKKLTRGGEITTP